MVVRYTVFGTRANARDENMPALLEGTAVDVQASPTGRSVSVAPSSFLPDADEAHFGPDAACPVRARDFAQRYLTRHDLGYLVDDISLVVSELVTNAAVEARAAIRARMEEMPFCVKLTVYDESVDAPVLRLATRVDTDDDSGRSSWLVDACTADWGTDLVAEEGKCTWALFAVRPRSSWINTPAGV